MNILQVMADTAVANNPWTANIVTTGLLLAIIGYFGRRYVEKTDKALAEVKSENNEIKKNYLARFDDVKREVQSSKDFVVDKMERKFDQVANDTLQHRTQQASQMGEIASDIKSLTRFCQDTLSPKK